MKSISNFLPERLRKIIERNGVAYWQVAEGADVGESTINCVINRNYKPSLDMIVKLADYFGVSIDYFFDRTDDETAKKMLDNEAAEFMERRRIAYENYILTGRMRESFEQYNNRRETPWPYNLIEAIAEQECQEVYPLKIINAVEEKLMSPDILMNERYKQMLLMYFKELKTLDEIGKIQGCGRERVRQIIAKALRILRNPAFQGWLVRDDEKIQNEINSLTATKTMLEDKIAVLEIEVKRLESVLGKNYGEIAEKYHTKELSLEEMDLSVRAFNCLLRAGCHTLTDVTNLAIHNKLISVRNLGKKTRDEVLDKLEQLTGINYRIYEKEAV